MAKITALTHPDRETLLDAYRPAPFFCELLGEAGADQPKLVELWQRLAQLDGKELRARAADASTELLDLGITFTVYSERDAIDRILPFDIIPRVIEAAEWRLVLEYPMRRLGRRIDAVLVAPRAIVVLEFKAGAAQFLPADRRQVEGYALDLQDFHAASRGRVIVPVLVVTAARPRETAWPLLIGGTTTVLEASRDSLGDLLRGLWARLRWRRSAAACRPPAHGHGGQRGYGQRCGQPAGQVHHAHRVDVEHADQHLDDFRARVGQRRLDLAGIVDEHPVKVVGPQNFKLILHIADHPFGRIIRFAFAIEAPFRGRVTAESTSEDNILTRNLFERQPCFAQRIAVAAGTIEVVDAQGDGMFHQGHGLFIFDKAEIIAIALGAKRDHRDL